MEVQFFYNTSDDRKINKVLVEGVTLNGVLRDEVSIMSPVIRFEIEGVVRFNYAYIPEFQRYYSIVDKNCVSDGLWDISMEVDVLMSFRRDIINLQAIVDKQSLAVNGDEYIDDGSLVTDNNTFSTVYNFPVGFNNTGEYVLITAG